MPPSEKRLTGYARLLQQNGLYPLPRRLRWKDRRDKEHKPATPFLIVPNGPGDAGARPLDAVHARHSSAIDVVDPVTHAVVTSPVPGHAYQLRCRVQNHGAVASYAALAEFYAAAPGELDALAAGTGPRPQSLGIVGLVVAANGEAVAVCPKPWNVAAPAMSVLVRVQDPLVDRGGGRYDPAEDRHVARGDAVPDFSGTWVGTETILANGSTTQIKIVIQQVAYGARIAVYSQVGGTIPAVPQESGSASVLGDTFTFSYTEVLGGSPFASNAWTFALQPGGLHFTHHCHFLQPGDPRADIDSEGMLARQ